MTNNIDKQSFGQSGATVVTNTAATAGDFCAIQVLEEVNFSAITWPELTGTLTGFAIPAGTVIYGQITAFTLASGKVLAYHQV
tara:strand:- start:1250 stop:1498 length:249 start_codon:yes stop_codon:yes gene_type:complete